MIAGRTKCWTVENDNWGRKEYRKESNIGSVKDKIKIRLYMCELKVNYRRKSLGNRCPMCQTKDTAEHGLECKKGDKKFTLNDERGKGWREIVAIDCKNKKNRSTIDNIWKEQNALQE